MSAAYDEEGRNKAIKRMKEVDELPKELRELVYEHGFTIIKTLLDCGVKKPSHIKHIIYTIMEGSYEIGNRSEGTNRKNIPHAERYLSEFFMWFKLPPVAKQALAFLIHKGRIIIPAEPSQKMIQASMDAVTPIALGGEVLTKEKKHKMRLRAALKAAIKENMTGEVEE